MTSLKEMELKILHTPSWELEKSPLILKARECQAAISLDTKIVLNKFTVNLKLLLTEAV